MLDQKKFELQIPKTFLPLLEELLRLGYTPTLVGGAVRDFFLKGNPGTDWDIELTHDTLEFDKRLWKDLAKSFSGLGKTTFLPYEILRVEVDSVQFEFSPPRLERYRSGEKGHSNFEADFSLKMPFETSVKRRDFTMNAMGIRFQSKKDFLFLDPLNGYQDLQNKVLQNAGEDFGKDPVRFLRALRFAAKYKFSLAPQLTQTLARMDLSDISPTYIWSEMQKSGDPLLFLGHLVEERKNHPELKLPVEDDLSGLRPYLTDPGIHESWIIALSWSDLSVSAWTSFFKLSVESSKRLERWAQTSKIFQRMLPEVFHGDFEVLRDLPHFEKLFDWYFTTKQLLQKHPSLPLMKMIEDFLPEWVHLYKFEPPKDVKHIDPPWRAKYQVWNLCQRL